MKFLVLLGLLVGCTQYKPKYEVDTCFVHNPLMITQIISHDYETNKYIVNIVTFILEQKRQFDFKLFDEDVEKQGLIGRPCKELMEENE